MAELMVRKATCSDMDAVMNFYSKMIDEMTGTNFDILWKHDVHPSNAFLRESVEKGYMYLGIVEGGNIACAMVIDRDAAPGYEKVPWEVAGPAEEVGIVHVVATRPAYHGHGYATRLLEEAFPMARADGLKSLHLDTFVDNVRSHGLYDKLGFVNHGTYPVEYEGYGDDGLLELDMFEYVL